MPGHEPTSERNLDGYGPPQIEWARVREVLDGEITQAPGRRPDRTSTHQLPSAANSTRSTRGMAARSETGWRLRVTLPSTG
jgi:hypothetical protein